MNILIIEDEINAFEYLQRLLGQTHLQIDSTTHLDSVKDAINFLSTNTDHDLMFVDIQLSDGLSFEIFDHVDTRVPVIFTTAYDQYALEAFKVNSVDYLLKPIHLNDLNKALYKFENNFHKPSNPYQFGQLGRHLSAERKVKRSRCLVKKGRSFEYIEVKDIAFIQSESSLTFLHTNDEKRYLYSKPLESLLTELDPTQFFQINRFQAVNIEPILEIHPYLNQRLHIKLAYPYSSDNQFIVSRKRVSAFKAWLDS